MTGTAAEALDASDARHWEGIVAKKADAPYRPGQRVHSWIKIKNSRVQEGIVVGWKPGSGRRAGTIGSLLLAIPEDGGLTYIGKVGTGFTDAVLDDLYGRLEPLRTKDEPGHRAGAEARCKGRGVGATRRWWVRCGSVSGPTTAGFATRVGGDCGRTRARTRCVGRASRGEHPGRHESPGQCLPLLGSIRQEQPRRRSTRPVGQFAGAVVGTSQ